MLDKHFTNHCRLPLYCRKIRWNIIRFGDGACMLTFIEANTITLCLLRTVKAGSNGVYTTKMAKHAGKKIKTKEKYKVTATQTHIYKFA